MPAWATWQDPVSLLITHTLVCFQGTCVQTSQRTTLKCFLYHLSSSQEERQTQHDSILRPHPVTFMVMYYYKCLNVLLVAGNLLRLLVFKLSLITSICVEEKM